MNATQTAVVDRANELFGAEVDQLATFYRSLLHEGVDKDQAFADLCAHVYAELSYPILAASVTVAVVRLVEQGVPS